MTARRLYVLWHRGCGHPVAVNRDRAEIERTASGLRLAGYSQWRVRLATPDDLAQPERVECETCTPELAEWARKLAGEEEEVTV